MEIGLKNRFTISPGIQFTNNASQRQVANLKLNQVTAGLNIFTNFNYYLLKKQKHGLSIGAGPVLRVQNSSVPTKIEYNLSPSGEQLYSIVYGKLRTIAIGYNVSPAYSYQICNKMSMGAKFILQNDTEGDFVTSQLVFIGLKL